MTKRQLFILIGFLIILIAIPVSLYLVRQTQIFAPRAAFIPKLEFVDASGNVITRTTSRVVLLKATKEVLQPPSPSPSPAVSPSPSPSPVVSPSPSPSPSPVVSSKRVFVTSTLYNGNLGGLAGADQKCQDRANATSLGGSWKAWLSSNVSSTNAKDRIPDAEYRRLDSVVVANNKTDLTDDTLDNPINRDESNTAVTANVWTGTKASGIFSNESCDGWKEGGFGASGDFGSTQQTNTDWTLSQLTDCVGNFRLYCFEQ